MKTMLIAAAAMAAAFGAPAYAADQPTNSTIVKDTTSNYWQIVLAGARKAGQDLGVKRPNWARPSKWTSTGRVRSSKTPSPKNRPPSSSPPTEFKALGKPVVKRRRKCRSSASIAAADFQGLHLVPDHRQRPGGARRP